MTTISIPNKYFEILDKEVTGSTITDKIFHLLTLNREEVRRKDLNFTSKLHKIERDLILENEREVRQKYLEKYASEQTQPQEEGK